MRNRTTGALALAMLVATACSGGREPDLGGIYNRSAMYHGPKRNPVIVIPGVLGSRLVDRASGEVVWGAFGPEAADPETPEGARLVALPLDGSTDDVHATGALDRLDVNLLGLPFQLSAYAQILGTLGVGGYADQQLAEAVLDYGPGHFTCFQLGYDWRLSNAENAARLYDYIVDRRAYVARELEKRYGVRDPDVRFDIVAHSMGGLVTRYMLRYGDAPLPTDGDVPPPTWKGAELVERAILIGTPNAGSATALLNTGHGVTFGPGLTRYGPSIVATFPSLFELLPRARHGRVLRAGTDEPIEGLFDPAYWERMGWGLADPDSAEVRAWLMPDVADAAHREEVARDLQARNLALGEAFHRALDVPASPPAGTELYLVAGDAEATLDTVEVDEATGGIEPLTWAPGDETVTRASALMDERMGGSWSPWLVSPIRWSGVTFVFADHLELTRDPAFSDNVLYLLLEAPRPGR